MNDLPLYSLRARLQAPALPDELEAAFRAPTPKMVQPAAVALQPSQMIVKKVLVIWQKGPHDYELEYHKMGDGRKLLKHAPHHLAQQLKSGDPNADKHRMIALGYSFVSHAVLFDSVDAAPPAPDDSTSTRPDD